MLRRMRSALKMFSMLVLAEMAETVSRERRGDQLGSLLAQVKEGSHVRELGELGSVKDSSKDGILCSL